MSIERSTIVLITLLALIATAGLAEPITPSSSIERSEEEITIENRLFAPCCWMQTLVNHESPIASTLRREIRERVARGQHATEIEDALAVRYGERIRAVPRGKDPFSSHPIVLGLAMAIAASVIVRIARRSRPSPDPIGSMGPAGAALSDEDEERLADELDHFDEH